MSLVYDEIFVGEKNRAMGILASSLPANDSHMLAHHLDLPGQPPQGFLLDTYVSGLAIKDCYVISRTSRDQYANRPGMVFSHAFVFNKRIIGQLGDIRAIFQLLNYERPLQFNPAQKTIATEAITETPPPGMVCDMLTTRPISAIVTTDNGCYEDLISRIWFRLLPSMRQSFRFKLSFSPEEAARENLNFALVPTTTSTRWHSNRRIDTYKNHIAASTLAGQSLSASDSGQLRKFAEKLEISKIDISMFGLLGQACELHETNNFASLLAALRLIGTLQPDPKKGLTTKTRLAKSIIHHPGPEKPEDILALRNLDWPPFTLTQTSPSNLKNKFAECFQVVGVHAEKQLIVESILGDNQSTADWQEAGRNALANLTPQAATGIATAVWNIILNSTDTGERLLQTAPNVILDKEMSVLTTLTADQNQQTIRQMLAKHRYFQSEAMLLRKHYGEDDLAALTEACKRDRGLFGNFAIVNILSTLSGSNKIRAAIDINDGLVMDAASQSVVDTPTLLSPFALDDERIQTIWIKALSLSPHAWQIDEELVKIQNNVLDTLQEGNMNPVLLTKIMNTPVGNWAMHKNRTNIWEHLSGDSLHNALNQTALGWIDSLPSIVHETQNSIEPMLAQAIAEPRYNESLLTAFKSCPFNDVLDSFLSNSHLSVKLFLDSMLPLFNSETKLAAKEVERMARLASARNWQSLSRKLFTKFGASGNLRPYFKICSDHLLLWDRIISGLRPPTYSDVTDLLLETTIQLYPTGLTEKDIWERAGGNLAHVDLSGNGRNQWHRCLRNIRLGGSIPLSNLLNQMIDDYPNNYRLQQLKEIV